MPDIPLPTNSGGVLLIAGLFVFAAMIVARLLHGRRLYPCDEPGCQYLASTLHELNDHYFLDHLGSALPFEPCACRHDRVRHNHGRGACIDHYRGQPCGCTRFVRPEPRRAAS